MTAIGRNDLPLDALTGVRRLLVPVNGSAVSLAALRLACTIATANKGKVLATYVIEVSRNLPLEVELPLEVQKSEEIFSAALACLPDRRANVEYVLLQARNAGATLVDEAVNAEVDAIVLGVPDRRRQANAVLGETAAFVLSHAPCQVWICRAPLRGEVAYQG